VIVHHADPVTVSPGHRITLAHRLNAEERSMEIVIVVGLILVVLIFFGMYNSLISRRNQVDQAFASIDVMLKRRHDLIPNLVAAVQGAMRHERELLTELTELRTRAITGDISPSERVATENRITDAIGRLNVAVENYPQLRANENFLQLQAALNEIEEQISAARRAYNASVTAYNTAIQSVPTNLIANMIGMEPRTLFSASERERANVDVGRMLQG
jgi:LemA protein